MMDREIRIPGPLRELHGETSTVFDLILVYAVGVAAGVLALVFAQSRMTGMEWWKAVLLFVVAVDVCGGAVACFTPGTALYYESRPRLRWVFIFVHFVEPGLLFVLFGGRFAYWAFLYVFTAAAASLVNVVQDQHRRGVLAAGLLALGIMILLPVGIATPFLVWFGPVYMIKLILAFAARRTGNR
jgi:hypothetical protein